VVVVPVLIAVMYIDRHEPTWGLVFVASLLAMQEFFSMTLEDKTDRLASLFIGAGAAAAFYWIPAHKGGHMLAIFLAVVPVLFYYLFRFGDMDTVARRLAFSIAGIVYGGLLFAFLAMLKRTGGGDIGGHLVLFVLAVAWLGDTGAYFAGRFLGNKKLYEAVSPKKTWAGAIGGIAASTGAAAVVKVMLLKGMPWVDVFALAIPGAIMGQMGDLAESLFKRSTKIKDSGSILPGHGGILDRCDAVLILAPYVYLYLTFKPQLV
jgi:phosphatidate cytidylyltransferase